MLGTTFGGNHLACAAALAVLEVIEEEKLMQNALLTGEFLINRLEKIKDLQNVRGQGTDDRIRCSRRTEGPAQKSVNITNRFSRAKPSRIRSDFCLPWL